MKAAIKLCSLKWIVCGCDILDKVMCYEIEKKDRHWRFANGVKVSELGDPELLSLLNCYEKKKKLEKLLG